MPLPLRPSRFRIGDKVCIKQGVTSYHLTTPGSLGVIENASLSSENVMVRFSLLLGGTLSERMRWQGTRFDIWTGDLQLVDETSPRDTLLELIQYLHHRQEFYKTHKDQLPSWG